MTKTKTTITITPEYWEDAGNDIIEAGVVKFNHIPAEKQTRDYPGAPAFTEYYIEDEVILEWRPPESMTIDGLHEALESICQTCEAEHPQTEQRLRFKVSFEDCIFDDKGVCFIFNVDEVEEAR